MKKTGCLQRKAQSTLEYAILVVIIIGVLLAIQVYVKRGLQGRLKSATDDIGDQYSLGDGGNYEKVVKTSSKIIDNTSSGTTTSNTEYSNVSTNITANWSKTESFMQKAEDADEPEGTEEEAVE